MRFIESEKRVLKLTSRQWLTLITLAIVNLGEAITASIQAPFYPAEVGCKICYYCILTYSDFTVPNINHLA